MYVPRCPTLIKKKYRTSRTNQMYGGILPTLFWWTLGDCNRIDRVTYFYKTLVDESFTYEELYTVLVRVEATLSSRPIVPIPFHPSDLAVITPELFLAGDSLAATTRVRCVHYTIKLADETEKRDATNATNLTAFEAQ